MESKLVDMKEGEKGSTNSDLTAISAGMSWRFAYATILPLLRNARTVKTKRMKRQETVHLLRLHSNFRGDLAFGVWDNVAIPTKCPDRQNEANKATGNGPLTPTLQQFPRRSGV